MYGHPLHVIHEKGPLDLNPGKPKRKLTSLKVLISIFLVSFLIYISTNGVKYEELCTYFTKPSNEEVVYTVETDIPEVMSLHRREDSTDKTTTTDKKEPTTTEKKQETTTTDKPTQTTKQEDKTTDKTTDSKNTDKTTEAKSTDKTEDSKSTDKPKDSKTTDKPTETKKVEDKNAETSSTKDSKKTTTKTEPTPTETETETSAPVPIYDQPGIRFVFALFGFILLNMFAIVIHHIYMISTKAGNSYKTVDDDISPF
ncbi:hypothetical protein JA1_000959 [Spathaspora sp. JA1]|nr:hypothetical protein JA1_000959 [Spathaspora sp. JA1]